MTLPWDDVDQPVMLSLLDAAAAAYRTSTTRTKGWRVLLPPWMLTVSGGLQPLIDSFESDAAGGRLPPGCIGFEIVGDLGVPEQPDHIYTCVRFRA